MRSKASLVIWLIIFLVGCGKHDLLRNSIGQQTLVGCLTAGSDADSFILADARTGVKTVVSGLPDLALHAENHAVKLIGFRGVETATKNFKVLSVEHIAASCKVPFQ